MKRNLFIVNKLSHKIAVASFSIALSLALGANKEAKAATLSLAPTTIFGVADFNQDEFGDAVFQNSILDVGLVGRNTDNQWESRAFYEFNIANLSLASNTVISSAIFGIKRFDYIPYDRFSDITLFGYRGNGRPDASDFDTAGSVVATHVQFYQFAPYELQNYNPGLTYLRVTPFINQLVNKSDAFAGFTLRSNLLNYAAFSGDKATLIIETANIAEPVPEPTTIFGSAIGLYLGGWLKRKKSNQQNKTAPQR